MPKPVQVGRSERVAGRVILALLLAVAGWVWALQFRPHPALRAIAASGAARPATAAPALDPLLAGGAPAGFRPLSPPETFDRETLSDKIDGKADLYLAAGFVGLTCQRLVAEADPTAWLEVFFYDMGNATNAFAVFSAQRRPEGVALPWTSQGYRAGSALFLVAGRHYVEVIGASESAALVGALEAVAHGVAAHASPAAGGAGVLAEAALFPPEDRAGEVQLEAADVFGFEQLDRVYLAGYRLDGKGAMAFLSRRASAGEAARLARAYAEFLLAYGGAEQPAPAGIPGARRVDVLGAVEIIFSRGDLLAGVHSAPDAATAAGLAARLARRLPPDRQVGFGP